MTVVDPAEARCAAGALPASDLLRLHWCPRCGYELAGLPREGKCPECGYAYDRQTFSLLGRAKGRGRFWIAPFTGFAFLVTMSQTNSLAIALVVTLACVLPWAIRDRYRKQELLVFTNEGVGRFRNPSEPVILPWSAFCHITFHRWSWSMRRQHRPTWRIELHREANAFWFRGGNPVGRLLAPSIVFKLEASESEARAIVEELRRRFQRGWGASVP